MSIREIGTALFISSIIFMPIKVNAGRGCCSSHGGVSGCSATGSQVCNDGTLSPSCTCTPPAVYGCTDYNAKNYNSNANKDDGSCTYYVYGCTDSSAQNYNPSAEKNDGSCTYAVVEPTVTENNLPVANTNDTTNIKQENNDSEDDDALGTIVGIGTIATGAYAYKKLKK